MGSCDFIGRVSVKSKPGFTSTMSLGFDAEGCRKNRAWYSLHPSGGRRDLNGICRQRLTLTSGFGAQSKTPSSS